MFQRTQGKHRSDFNVDDLYDFYKDYTSVPVVRKNLYYSIIRDYWNKVMPDIIENGIEIKLPHRLGAFRIMSKDYKIQLNKEGKLDKFKLVPDWGATLKSWKELYPDVDPKDYKKIPNKKVIYILNEHTERKRFLWFWDRVTCNILHQSLYKIDVTRKWDRHLATFSKDTSKYKMYYEFNKRIK